MTVGKAELTVHEFLVVFLDVTRTGHLQQVVAVVHQFAEGVERADYLGHIGDDSFLVARIVGNLRHEVVHDGGIDGEFHLLGVNEHEFQLVGVLLI